MAAAALAARVRQDLAVPAADVALAVVLAAFALVEIVSYGGDMLGPYGVHALTMPAAALALAWRRRRPLAVLVVVLCLGCIPAIAWGTNETWGGTFIYVAAVYSAALYGSAPLVAGALAVAGIVVFSVADPLVDSLGEALWGPSLAVLTVGAGLTGRALRERSTAVERRSEALDRDERERAAEAAAEERRRIARELHDIVSHSLGVVVLQAGAAERVLHRDPARAREVLASIRATGQEAIGEMGTLLGLLDAGGRPSREPPPSLADLDRLVARMSDAGLSVELTREGRQRPLPAALELSAFRVVQEGLTNALRHAGAADVHVVVRYAEDELRIDVADDGTGDGGGPGGRRGLAGITERVEVFGGRLEAGPRAGSRGWALRASFPVAR
jgi:signal transduction histidine kinase